MRLKYDETGFELCYQIQLAPLHLGATNRVDAIDGALRRPVGPHICCSPPHPRHFEPSFLEPNGPISVYHFPRRALTLCPQLCMGIQAGARFPARSADALSATLCMGISPGRYTEISILQLITWPAIAARPHRAGRFDRELAFPLPNATARAEILKVRRCRLNR